MRVLQAAYQIGVDQFGHFRVLIEQAPDLVQLTGVLVLDCGLDK